ncbi:YceI family protein [Chitinophagaceae bacterium LB-8]|uniref:YceI family protein n=1 Tax=Paraflavisolibacter caeni TaxID=2982496 RepID=A0A9X3BG18_9BACT|nr:YceI family protein [Paraflavisolibacter caeni]MCU7550104.1 YceI family protein [Paraflavisolibacter caeni]
MEKTKWVLDPTHSELGFKIKHLMISNVSGSFNNFQVEMQSSGDDLTSAAIYVTADVASIDTKNEQRDAHLRTSDFFEAEQYPELKFQSTKVEKTDDETYIVWGNLTIKGITKLVQLSVEYSGVTKEIHGAVKGLALQ